MDRVFVGPFMTSLDMAGMSLTLLRVSKAAASAGGALKLLELLDSPVGASGWPATSAIVNVDAGYPTPVPGAVIILSAFSFCPQL